MALVAGVVAIALNPHFWAYPTLFMYLFAALDHSFYLFGRSAGWFHPLEHFGSSWHVEWLSARRSRHPACAPS
jgi:hypothetical protein